jgi:hypothetical protein
MSIADKFLSFAQTLSARLNSINVSLVNKGQSEAETYAEIPAKIDAIETGADLSGVTATASDVLAPKVFVDSNGTEQTGTIETKTTSDVSISGNSVSFPSGYYADTHSGSVAVATQATPNISVDSSTGVITASATQSAGYVSSGTKSATEQLNTKSATTYTPSTSNQTISSGYYLTGTQTIQGDSNLVASNIKNGVNIFGVTGSYSGGDYSYCFVYASDNTELSWTTKRTDELPKYTYIIMKESQGNSTSDRGVVGVIIAGETVAGVLRYNSGILDFDSNPSSSTWTFGFLNAYGTTLLCLTTTSTLAANKFNTSNQYAVLSVW